jgi:O-antigen/teichoic acid export membrane protein
MNTPEDEHNLLMHPDHQRPGAPTPEETCNRHHDDDWSDQVPTLPLAAIDISQAPTDGRLPAVGAWLPARGNRAVGDWPVDQMPTRILPVFGARSVVAASPSTEPQATNPTGAAGYVGLLRSLIASSGIYALAAMAAPLVSLVLAPFLTHHLSPANYGILTILNTAIGLTAGVTQLGLGTAFFRAYNYDYAEPHDRRSVVSTITLLLCLTTAPIAIGVAIMASFLANLLFGRPALGNLVALAGWVVLLQNLTVPGFAWLRAENRALFFSLLSIANLLISLTANILLVGALHMGVAGSLLATGSGYASVLICTGPVILLRAGIRVRADIAWSILTFGGPQVLSFVSYWVLQLSDRYLLSIFGSLAQTASYAVAYSLGTVLSTVVIAPFSLAWPMTMFTVAKRQDAADIFKLIFRWFSLFLLFAGFCLSFAGTLLLDRLFPVVYHAAAPVIPIVAESIVFFGVYNIFMIGVNVERKTWLAAVFTATAAGTNFGLNLILIPHYGAMGAAASTLIAYAALAMISYIANQRIYPIPFEIGRFLSGVLAGVALYLGSATVAHAWGTQWTWPIDILALVLYATWLLFLGKGLDRICRSLIQRGGL